MYLPTLGRFTAVDPVQGGTPNSYVYPTDPIEQSDLNGCFSWKFWQRKPASARPSAARGYAHWLLGGGKSQTMKASSISWKMRTSDLNHVGHHSALPASASAQGFNASEHIGRVSGTFSGSITKTSSGYRAVGTYTPNTDIYDFNFDPRRTAVGNAAGAVGTFGGMVANQLSFGIIRPTSYNIYFIGSAQVDQSW